MSLFVYIFVLQKVNNAFILYQAADFIAATAANHALSSSFPIHKVEGVSSAVAPNPGEQPANIRNVLFGAIIVLFLAMLIGVLVSTHRKKATGVTWFPEGFLRNNRYVHRG